MEGYGVGNRYPKARFLDIVNQYGLQLYRIKPYDSLYKKNAVFRASTNKGKFLIKSIHKRTYGMKLTKEQQSDQLSSYIKKLKAYKYPYYANWLTTKSGRYYMNKNGKPYYMTEWIKGHSLQNNVQDYEALGRALANLHTLYKDSHSSKISFTKRHIKLFKHQERLFKLRLTVLREKKTFAKKCKKWFRRHGDRCKALTNEAWKIFRTPEVKQIISEEIKHPALIHGDVTIPNIIINSRGLFLIDWDCLRKGSTYNEMAKALLNTTNYNPVHMEALLRGYEELKPLKSAERLLICGLFRLPREAWSEARNIVLGRGHRSFRLLKQTWDERLKAISWLDEWARKLP
jgi:Ser/Thr protein kinase RdoA (MazF antagonist)